ncbi:hypothetical protein [Larsenimonas suaedae]|uniref:Peptidase S24/S26A/S26B/S26C domain-containing protein n=1 Tax=Larsenimonas suaedae TaxID=1851019 RepID=A0ABU1H106_9GAMM|nr:hypothetical protein [Larsenimonas suaedae]MCM2973482.1 hypothetical protein [Larsenimonas suaedae]MDR5897342.1 hypothetical protein [Larsenimonas suaedae]
MRVVYRVPVPAMSSRPALKPDSAAFHWQQFFAPHAGVSFLVEIVEQPVSSSSEWSEGDWLVISEQQAPADNAPVVVDYDGELRVMRYRAFDGHRHIETLEGAPYTDARNATLKGVVVNLIRQVS